MLNKIGKRVRPTNFGMAFCASALLLLVPDAYVVFGVMGDASWWWRVLFLLPTLLYFVVVFSTFISKAQSHAMVNRVLWATLAIFFPIVIFAAVSLAGLCLGCLWPPLCQAFNWIALGLAGVWLGVVIYGIAVGWKKVTVERVALSFPTLPASFDNYKIIHLSDFHIGTYLAAPQTVSKIVDTVNSLNPDLIVFTGDLVNLSPDEIRPFINELKRLKAKDGVVSILGNHDYCLYKAYTPPDSPQKAVQQVVAIERELGWNVLLNQSERIMRNGQEIALIGVENAGGKHFVDRSDLKTAMAGIPADEFNILLSHDPTHWRRGVVGKTSISLMLAGHTHAMQLKIGHFSPAKWTYKEWGGVYREGNQALVVSTGTGGNVAFRFGAYPQILEITLTTAPIE